ncbi:MAG: hypothetical protein PHQ97_01070, partial [Desulfobacterales bacterium]|nr:hypothetical protein [Desulfobacterales bacterium]
AGQLCVLNYLVGRDCLTIQPPGGQTDANSAFPKWNKEKKHSDQTRTYNKKRPTTKNAVDP